MSKWSYLDEHYNKFNEDKRLLRRHGQVEFLTSMRYINKYIEIIRDNRDNKDIKILDIGAGTGGYSIPLDNMGYDVSAVELVKYNVGILKSKNSNIKAYQGNALKLKKFENDCFDIVLLFGPMYHLFAKEDKVKALLEAKRVLKPGGVILVAYLMNDYSIIRHGFMENFISECVKNNQVDEEFRVRNSEEDLYDYITIMDIDELNEKAGLSRIQIIASTGPSNYIRAVLKGMDEETFGLYMKYHFSTCERMDLIGASSHTVDILGK